MYLLSFTKKGHLMDIDAYSVKEFADVLEMDQGDRLFYAVALSVDYKSVFRMYQEEDRWPAVLKQVFGATQPAGISYNSSKVERAKKAYLVLQYDDLEEDLKIVRKKMKEVNDLLEDNETTMENYKTMQDLLMSKEKYIKQRSQIEGLIEKRGELVDLKLGDDIILSRLEQKLAKKEAIG